MTPRAWGYPCRCPVIGMTAQRHVWMAAAHAFVPAATPVMDARQRHRDDGAGHLSVCTLNDVNLGNQ